MLLNIDILVSVFPVRVLIGVGAGTHDWHLLMRDSFNRAPNSLNLELFESLLFRGAQVHFMVVNYLVLLLDIERVLRIYSLHIILFFGEVLLVV